MEAAIQIAEKAKLEAENANRAKDFFLANMSHEIRTPLNAVIGMAEILDAGDLSKDKQQYYINIILNSAISLMGILNDILDFSKIEAGKMELETSPFNLKALTNEMVETFSVTAAGKSIYMKAEIDDKIDEVIIGDYTRIRQIFVNLIGNAIKFTHEGTVIVGSKKISNSDGKINIEIYVKDNGIGIPKESQNRIFESFRQADSTTTRKYGGTGLGLSIVKNLVELMNGELLLESESGKGSAFICKIPFDVSGNSTEGECFKSSICSEKTEIDYERLKGVKVLVAEDNRINREIAAINLKKLNCMFEFAENGLIVCDMFSKSNYDIVLMDIMMPEMDGLQATKILRKQERELYEEKHTPIIALTAGATQDDIEACIDAGMTDHLSKPIRIAALYEMLKKYT